MTQQTRHFILGAAGHVDHGKTALITALTGTNTDRLKEERERGISIELGFAELDLGDGVQLGVVDMPGHEKFVRQMVSGAGGVDLAFLVIAADEGVMPQTIEHLEILDSLGVRSGLVVVAKIDMVDDDFVAVVTEEAAELVAGTFLEGKPIVPVSAHKGTGLDALKAALKAEALALPARAEQGAFRLPVDRVFTMPGAGVVVTGTCWGGAVAEGDRLVLQPGDLPVRVREVQVHGRKAAKGASGQRLALALHGVKREDVERGAQLVAPGAAQVTRRLDIRTNVMPHYQGLIKNRQRLHIHHAGREVLGRIVLLDEPELGGDTGTRTALAQLHLEEDLVAARDDRLVLRFYSPVTSIAGGIVLDTNPKRHKRFDEEALDRLSVFEDGDPAELFRQQLKAAGLEGLPLAEAAGFEADAAALPVGKRVVDRALADALADTVTQLVADYGQRFPLRLGMPKEEARRRVKFKGGANEWSALVAAVAGPGRFVVAGDRLASSPEGPALPAGMAEAVAAAAGELQALGLDFPGVDAFGEASPTFLAVRTRAGFGEFKPLEVLRHLVDHGLAVAVSNEYFVHVGAMAGLLDALKAHFAGEPELAFARFREISGLTRKLGIPMLEYLDENGLTVRDGDVRRAGPALGNA
ncbi:MAG TPA: selenocysteine-specific translation elongation factor [Candidatus Krumholzibacteria bacterium]|nr:selenocysteine-specific translation elongation factor [Candidatus Krumholzibacteria bacterium]